MNTKICSECAKPGAKAGYVTLDGERLYVTVHPECKKIIKARHDEWRASEEGQEAVAEHARITAQAAEIARLADDNGQIYGMDAAWVLANVGLN
jgi:hypothetical protein